jgi:hypothetical protein
VLHNSWRSHLFTNHDHCWQNSGRYIITNIGIPSLTTNKLILYCVEISALEKIKVLFIF